MSLSTFICQSVRLPTTMLLSSSVAVLTRSLSTTSPAKGMPKSKPFVINEKMKRIVRFRELPGQNQPTVVIIPGLHSYSHMSGMVAKCIFRYCDIHSLPLIMYDHECMGESSVHGDMTKVLFSHWVEDAVTVIEDLTEGPVCLVSLSMGGWLATIAAMKMPSRIHSMILFSPAINYVYKYFKKQRSILSEDVRNHLDAGGIHLHTHTYGDALLKKDFAEDSLNYEIDLEKPVSINCPVRIIHGLQDQEVEPSQSMKLVEQLKSNDVDLIFRKSCKHQLTEIVDIELLLNSLDRVIKEYPVRRTT